VGYTKDAGCKIQDSKSKEKKRGEKKRRKRHRPNVTPPGEKGNQIPAIAGLGGKSHKPNAKKPKPAVTQEAVEKEGKENGRQTGKKKKAKKTGRRPNIKKPKNQGRIESERKALECGKKKKAKKSDPRRPTRPGSKDKQRGGLGGRLRNLEKRKRRRGGGGGGGGGKKKNGVKSRCRGLEPVDRPGGKGGRTGKQ